MPIKSFITLGLGVELTNLCLSKAKKLVCLSLKSFVKVIQGQNVARVGVYYGATLKVSS
jgi:hypothetical protein